MPKIDLKLVAATTLILGLFAGFYIDNTLLSKPRIQTLTQTVTEQTTTITTLETQLDELGNEHDTLQALYDQLNANNVPLSQYNQLQDEKTDLEATITEQETQIESLLSSVDTLQAIIDEKEADIQNLEAQLEDLQEEYDAIYNPLQVSFTSNGLTVTLTTTKDIYSDNTAISGTVIIRYTDGAPFHGTYKLSIYKVYVNSGTTSDSYDINGASTYTWSSPFVLGAGSYKLSLSEIKDTEGASVVPSTVLRSKVIYLFEG